MSSRFQRTREIASFARSPKRYIDENSSADEDDIAEQTDPSEWRDQQTPTISERLARRKIQLLVFGWLGVVVLLILGVYSRRYFPGLYADPWVREGLKWIVVVPVAGAIAARMKHQQFAGIDELTLTIDGEGSSMYGEFDTDADGNRIFRPYRGFTMLGMAPRRLTLADLGRQFDKTFAKAQRDPDDPAVIRLEDGLCTAVDTATGVDVHVVTSGLEVDAFGENSDVFTAPPDMADEAAFNDLVKTLEKVYSENADLQERIDTLERQKGEWKREAKQTREEIVSEFLETHKELSEIVENNRRPAWQRSSRSSGNGTGTEVEA